MKGAKELAERVRTGQPISPEEVAIHLDRLAAIDSAEPEEVREIAERLAGVRALPWASQAERYLSDIATLLAIVQRLAGEIAEQANGLDEYDGRVQRLRNDLGTAAGVDVFVHAKQVVAERNIARAEVERLKERGARDDAGVTIHACPPKGESMMPCCNRPPFEVMADRMTTNPALVNCDRVRLQTERTTLAQEHARLIERLRTMQHGEAEALKMMAAEKQRADNAESDLRMMRDDWEAMRSTASAEYKGWKMFRGTHEGAAHSHRCDTCGFTWQHSASQVSRMGAAGKVRVHRCQNCGAMQRFIDDAEPEQQIAPPVGQAGGEPERWDKNLPSTQIPAYLCAACTLEVEVGETFGFCPKCSKPLEMNPRWVAETPEVEQMAKQQEPAEVPRWSGCHANRDGDCNWTDCPQAHDGEPARSGRSCPLWTGEDES